MIKKVFYEKNLSYFFIIHIKKWTIKLIIKETEKGEENKQEINIETYLKKIKSKKREYGKNKYHIISEEDKNKEREQARDKYRNLSEEDKNKKREYGKNR